MEDPKLWELMGKVGSPSAPPFFAAKVMRQIQAGAPQATWSACVLRWLAPVAVTALVIVALLPRPDTNEPAVNSADLTILDLVQLISPEDYETLAAAGWPYNNGFLSSSL